MATASDLLAVARGELGTKESPANSNRVKYNTAYYGREVSGTAYPWCAVFVWWCCQQASVELPVKTASCSALRTAARAVNLWVTGGYQPGDIVIYDWGGDGVPDHCGIVESVEGSIVTAIEGNTATGNDSDGGEVMRRRRSLSQIMGAVHPVYDEEDEEMDVEKLTDSELVRLAERIQEALGKLEVGSTLAPELEEAKELGITDGTRPNAFCTRAQAAVMVKRLAEK